MNEDKIEPNLQYFNDAQYYSLAMNTRDEVIVAGRGVGKGAIQARRLQSCFQGMPGSMGGFVAPSVKRCLTNILPSMLIHLERWGFKRDLHYVVGKRPWKKLHWKSPIFTPAHESLVAPHIRIMSGLPRLWHLVTNERSLKSAFLYPVLHIVAPEYELFIPIL